VGALAVFEHVAQGHHLGVRTTGLLRVTAAEHATIGPRWITQPDARFGSDRPIAACASASASCIGVA